jgi:hypothetical protein
MAGCKVKQHGADSHPAISQRSLSSPPKNDWAARRLALGSSCAVAIVFICNPRMQSPTHQQRYLKRWSSRAATHLLLPDGG